MGKKSGKIKKKYGERTSLLDKDQQPEQGTFVYSLSIDRYQLLWLLKLAIQEWVLVAIGSFFLFIGSATSLVLPDFVGRLIDQVLTSTQGKVIFFYLTKGMVITSVIIFICIIFLSKCHFIYQDLLFYYCG